MARTQETGRTGSSRLFALFSFALVSKGAAIAAPLFLSGAAIAMPQVPLDTDKLQQVSFADLPDWESDNHLAALTSFLRFCSAPGRKAGPGTALVPNRKALSRLCTQAPGDGNRTQAAARSFFEEFFTPYRIEERGFVTGYFEPEVEASRRKTEKFQVPLLRKPSGLESVPPDSRPANWPPHLSHGRRTGLDLKEMPDRGAIMDGALDGEALELVWLADPVDAYFIHVQGSARLRLTDGSTMRVGYAGKTGHPYTGIGKLLVDRGEGTPEDFTMSGLRNWLHAHRGERDALFRENRSYIFFREVTETGPEDGPIGAAGLPLTAGRSLAVDPDAISYGLPVFVSADMADWENVGAPFRRLLVADDTGSAIKGGARGDIFVGSGREAGRIAGDIRHRATFTVLLPKGGLAAPEPGAG